MKLYVVGRQDLKDHVHAWEMVGIFDNEEKAVEACKTVDHFIGPLLLNENIEDGKDWPGVRWPVIEKEWKEYRENNPEQSS